MPANFSAYATGAALVGLPFFNGFWSKELLLETALEGMPYSVYLPLVIGAAVTAFYAARMCRMVFFAPAHDKHTSERHVVPYAMSLTLALLALGVVLAWLLAEPFATWMKQTSPFHTDFILPHRAIESLISTHTVFAWSTLIVLTVSAIGLYFGWRAGKPKTAPATFASGIGRIEAFFNDSAGAIVTVTRNSAATLQKAQTGQLNWNIAGIILGLIALLIIILQGVL